MLQEVLNEIARGERFVLTSHARPDGDAIGSTLACGEILRQMGKHADTIFRDGIPRVYQQLPFMATASAATTTLPSCSSATTFSAPGWKA